ncbi:MAG: hypothetical protein KBE65_09620 [Phycisphaerae bacterium]|nr:hypothetical protein [Phycisphaerae bacterium]
MTSSGKRTATVAVFVVLLVGAGQAFGNLYAIDYRPLGAEITFSSLPEYEDISNPFSVSYSGGTAMFSIPTDPDPDPDCFQVWVQGASGWAGAFTDGDDILWTGGNAGPLTIEFSSGISAFATQIQPGLLYETGTARIWAYAGSTLLGTFSVDSISDEEHNYSGDDSAALIGVEVISGSAISRIVLDIDGFTVHDFAINQISFVPVPVPGAVLLGLLGLSTAGLKLRRHG